MTGSAGEQPGSVPSPEEGLPTHAIHRRRIPPRPPESQSGPAQVIAPGERCFGFLLKQELGHGAFARVYLAEQAELWGRPVVLKITDRDGKEPQFLALLQHTHIVPIYSVHDDPHRDVRAVCMPYFGGADLLTVLRHVWKKHSRPSQGSELLEALRAVGGPFSHLPVPGEIPWEKKSYIEAVVWLVARLAEALQYAHDRGVLHSDIKPSNVLLTAEGQPMLLDFNVARSFDPSQTETASCLGGTMTYMAPEHLRALGEQSAPPGHVVLIGQPVDHRADLYSLGVVLYEALTGIAPFASTRSSSPITTVLFALAEERSHQIPSARKRRLDVPWSLESILRRALAPDPRKRYERCDQMAEDLRRFLDNRPLLHAPELSWRERTVKWFRRHPQLTSSGTVALGAAVLLGATSLALATVHQHSQRTQLALERKQLEERLQYFEAGANRALCLVHTFSDVHDHQKEGMALCEQTLDLFGVLRNEGWQNHQDWQRLPPEARRKLAESTRELLLLLASARVRRSPQQAAVLREALTLLDRAESLEDLPDSPAIHEERARYLETLGEPHTARKARARAERTPPATAQDHYLLALGLSRTGQFEAAIQQLSRAIESNPRHYWALMQRGICYQEVGRSALAAADFGTCIGLWPEFAWGTFNRGCVFDRAGHKEEAIRDYTIALERDPNLVPALVNRAMARLERKQHQAALADLQLASRLGRDDCFLHLGLGIALEGSKRTSEADEEYQLALERGKTASKEARLRLAWVYGFAVSERLPGRAREAFSEVRKQAPEHPQALYGEAMLLAREGKDRQSIDLLTRAAQAAPAFTDARRYRAILLARVGRFEDALSEVNFCLEKEPASGPVYYAAACVAALARVKATNPELQREAENQAFLFLEKAFALGYGREQAGQDPDLGGLRKHPRFRNLLDVHGVVPPG